MQNYQDMLTEENAEKYVQVLKRLVVETNEEDYKWAMRYNFALQCKELENEFVHFQNERRNDYRYNNN